MHPCKDPASAWSWVFADPNDGKYSWTSVYERGTVGCILHAINAICRMAQLVWSNVFLCGSIAARYAQVHCPVHGLLHLLSWGGPAECAGSLEYVFVSV